MKKIGAKREIAESELELMLSWRNAPGVRKNMYSQEAIGYETHLAWWAEMQKRDDHKYFMYELENIPLGVISFNSIDTENHHAFWAFYASPEAPRGTGTKMEFIALNYAFDVLALRKLSCEVLAYNNAVLKLHEKFGFQTEGLFREHYELDGENIDVYRLGILRAEWIKQRPIIQKRLDNFNEE